MVGEGEHREHSTLERRSIVWILMGDGDAERGGWMIYTCGESFEMVWLPIVDDDFIL